jgi:transposase InsO family protein
LGILFTGKSQTQETLKGFLRRAQKEFGLRIKKIRSDNETEFKNSQIEGFLEEEGIKHEFSSPYTPQQNGVVERKNRTLLDMARTMLDEYKTLDRFWAEAINTACYSINRLYLLKGKCALGPFLSILVIECKHKGLNVNLCTWMNKVKIMK